MDIWHLLFFQQLFDVGLSASRENAIEVNKEILIIKRKFPTTAHASNLNTNTVEI